MANETTRYLGDGVYARFDGYQIWLTVGDHHNRDLIAINPDVLNNLTEFYEYITTNET